MAELSKLHLVYLHCVEGATIGPRTVPDGFSFEALRRSFSGLYMANNGYDRALALQARAAGTADLICFGRAFIGNPDLVERLRRNAPLTEAPKDTWYGGGAKGYTDYPALQAAA